MVYHLVPEPCDPIELGDFFLEDRWFCAVYFLYHRGEVVYVGQSRTLKLRIDGHISEGVKVFDAVAFIRCDFRELTRIEGHYIRELAPKYNKCAITRKARERESWKQVGNLKHYRRSRFDAPLDPNAEMVLIDAAECIIEERDIGEFLNVSDREAFEWREDGLIKGTSVLDLLRFMYANSREVRKAQDRFELL